MERGCPDAAPDPDTDLNFSIRNQDPDVRDRGSKGREDEPESTRL